MTITDRWKLLLTWLAITAACVGLWYLLFVYVLYPYALSSGSLFRMAATQ